MGCGTRPFHASGPPLPDDADASRPKVVEPREARPWSEAQVWTSPVRHVGHPQGADRLGPLLGDAISSTQGRILAVMQGSAGSQGFDGHWMRIVTIPNQSSVARAWQAFTEEGRMRPSAFCERVAEVMEEPVKVTLLTRGASCHLADRHGGRKEAAAKLEGRVSLKSIQGLLRADRVERGLQDGRGRAQAACREGGLACMAKALAAAGHDLAGPERPSCPGCLRRLARRGGACPLGASGAAWWCILGARP